MKGDFDDKILKIVISGFFLTEKGELLVARDLLIFQGINKDSIPSLVSQNKKARTGKWLPFDKRYFYLDSIPDQTRKKLKLDFNEEFLKETLIIHTNCPREVVLDRVKKTAYLNMLTEVENYKKYIFTFYDHYGDNAVRHTKAITFAILRVILPLVRKFKKGLIKHFYELLCSEKKAIDNRIKEAKAKGFEVVKEPLMHEIPLESQNYFYKYLNRMEDIGIPKALIHQGKGKPSNNLKLTPLIKDIIVYLKSYGNPTSATAIHKDLKAWFQGNPLLKNKDKCPDADTVRDFLATAEAKNLTMLSNMGFEKFEKKILGYLPLERPKHPLTKVSADGYHFQVKCEGDDSLTMSFVGFFIKDNYSDVVICDLDDSENFELIGRTFEKYLQFTRYKFPAEFVVDGFTDRQTKHFKNFRTFLETSGVIWNVKSDPKAKAKLERWFGSLQTVSLSQISGYVGEGIKSRRDYAHPSKQVIIVVTKRDYLKGKNEMKRLLLAAVDDYNRNAFYDHANAPLTIHQSKNPKYFKQLQPYHSAYFFWDKHEVTISGSMIVVRKEQKKWFYREAEEFDFTLKNDTKVDVYHKSEEDSCVHLFETKSNKFLYTVQKHFSAREAKAEQTKQDKQIIANFGISKQQLHKRYIEELDNIETRLIEQGVDPETLRSEAAFKKQADEYDGYKIGIATPTPDPNLFGAHKLRLPIPRGKKTTNPGAVKPTGKGKKKSTIDTF